MKTLSDILTYLMSKKGIKSAELARKTGIGQPVIYRLMTGTTENPQILTIKPIADFFNITLDQLLGFSPLNFTKRSFDSHDFNNKITTMRAITSVIVELLPILIEGYEKAIAANLVEKNITTDILPLLPLNANNLLKTINFLDEYIK